MADECRRGGEIWRDFAISFDEAPGTMITMGALRILPHATSAFSGFRRDTPDGPDQEPLERGKCRVGGGTPARRIMTFQITRDGVTYVFRGEILNSNVLRIRNGTFFILSNTNPRVREEPGDTGTWGGNQGALLARKNKPGSTKTKKSKKPSGSKA